MAEMEERKISIKEQIAELGIARCSYFRYKKMVPKLLPSGWAVSNKQGTDRRVRKIDRSLNPIQFCDKYLPVKPNRIQRLIIKAFYNLEFTREEKVQMLRWRVKGWTTHQEGKKYKELVLLAGMKGGKTTLASLFVQIEEYQLFKLGDPTRFYGLVPGTETWILNVATDKDQARDTIFAVTKASIDRSPYFRARKAREIGSSFIFEDTNVRIQSGHSNSASLVGRSCKLVLSDEMDRFKTRGGKYSADAVYRALNRSTDPFGEDGHIISISSLVNEHGIMVDLYQKSKKIDNMLGFWLPEWEMRKDKYSERTFMFMGMKIPIEHKNEFDKDPEGFLRDKACMIGFTKGAYYRMPIKVTDCFEQAHNEGCKNPMDNQERFADWFKQQDGFKYFMHGDASIKHDSYGIALGHRDKENAVIDFVHRITPSSRYGEIDLEKLKQLFLLIIDRFPGVELFTYDTWAAAVITQEFTKLGKQSENLYIKKPQHDLLKEKIYRKQLKCYSYRPLIKEIKELELQGDKVDHPVDGSSDVENAVAGVVWNCMNKDTGITAAFATSGQEESKEEEELLSIGRRPLRNIGRKRIWER